MLTGAYIRKHEYAGVALNKYEGVTIPAILDSWQTQVYRSAQTRMPGSALCRPGRYWPGISQRRYKGL